MFFGPIKFDWFLRNLENGLLGGNLRGEEIVKSSCELIKSIVVRKIGC